jgi:RNA polymerase sigma-70 factor (ECF subfamily)
MVLHPVADDERELVARLRAGDADAFTMMVSGWSPAMLRLAEMSDDGSAPRLVQRAWLMVIERLPAYRETQSLRAWVFRILVGLLGGGTLPQVRADDAGPCVEPDRFRGPDDTWTGGWTRHGTPQPWPGDPPVHWTAAALDRLPAGPRVVVTLRDVYGFTADEVSQILGLSDADQRQLLHRGRSRLRAALEQRYRETAGMLPS